MKPAARALRGMHAAELKSLREPGGRRRPATPTGYAQPIGDALREVGSLEHAGDRRRLLSFDVDLST